MRLQIWGGGDKEGSRNTLFAETESTSVSYIPTKQPRKKRALNSRRKDLWDLWIAFYVFNFLATTILASMRLSSSRLARKRSLLLLLLLWWRGFTSYRSRLNTGFSKATWPPELPLLLGIAPEISTRGEKSSGFWIVFHLVFSSCKEWWHRVNRT